MLSCWNSTEINLSQFVQMPNNVFNLPSNIYMANCMCAETGANRFSRWLLSKPVTLHQSLSNAATLWTISTHARLLSFVRKWQHNSTVDKTVKLSDDDFIWQWHNDLAFFFFFFNFPMYNELRCAVLSHLFYAYWKSQIRRMSSVKQDYSKDKIWCNLASGCNCQKYLMYDLQHAR